jgi:superfamily II DNA or RNA helicase
LVNGGWLAPIAVHSLPLQIDLSQVRQTGGDFNDSDLGAAIEPYLSEIARLIAQHAAFRRVLAFLPLRATSRKFVEHCRAAGLSAEHIDGESPDRKEILKRFSRFEFDVLSNAMLLTEGFDDPGIDCVVVLRPTKSRPLYAQMVGRGTRIAEAKGNLLLLDFLWMHQKHSICRPAHLIAGSDEEAQIITALAQEKSPSLPGEGVESLSFDLQDLASGASRQREEALRKRLEENKRKKGKKISAEEFALSHGSMDLAEYEPVMAWEQSAVSEKQAIYLKRAKIDISTVTCRGHASKLLDIVFRDAKPRLAAPKAIELMRRLPGLCASIGIQDPSGATAAQAGRFFKALKERKQQPELV